MSKPISTTHYTICIDKNGPLVLVMPIEEFDRKGGLIQPWGRVLVCGGRDYNDKKNIFTTLDQFHKENNIILIIQGWGTGCDRIADNWAYENKILSTGDKYQAHWTKFGYKAGPIRNLAMLKEERPNLIIAFPGGPGTKNMISQASQTKIPVYIISENGEIT